MANQKGDIVSIIGYGQTQFRLTNVADYPETVVQYAPVASEKSGEFKTTDASDIAHNYTEAARGRYKKKLAEEKDWLEKNNLTDSLNRALDQSAKGETESLGSFAQYAEDDMTAEEFDQRMDEGVPVSNYYQPPWHDFNRR